jgi:hypothetical protein
VRRLPKEILFLLALLVCAAAGVLWYVLDRRARQHAASPIPPAVQTARPPAAPVDLTKHDAQTIDFSSGQPVVKDAPEDKAALDAAVAEMRDAAKDVTFEAPKKKPEAPAEPPPPEP